MPGLPKSLLLITTAVVFPILLRSCTAMTTTPSLMIESRLRSALWGMFCGDALASPTHWYYGGECSQVGYHTTLYVLHNCS